MPDTIARDYLELLQVTKAADEIDSIKALRVGLTAAEGELVRARLEARRAELLDRIKSLIDDYAPEAGRDYAIAAAVFDWRRAETPTGRIGPIGKRDIELALNGMGATETTDVRIENVWSFCVKMPGVDAEETRCAIWDWEGSADQGTWYCYGNVEIMQRLFGHRYVLNVGS